VLWWAQSAWCARDSTVVFIAVIDGARYTETFGDSLHQYIPGIWNTLRPQGTIFTSFYNDSATSTNPGHSSIVTGTWQHVVNDGSERPHKPTIFEYYRQQKHTKATENYVILGKKKLNILAYSDCAGYGELYGAAVCTAASFCRDAEALENAKK
jgi:hypothetical protein